MSEIDAPPPTDPAPPVGTAEDAVAVREGPPTEPGRLDAFISYARRDGTAFAEALHQVLAEHGMQVWVDRHNIEPASDWRQRIERGIAAANALVFVVTPAAVDSSECRHELDVATGLNKLIVPVVANDEGLDHHRLPAAITERNWVFWRPGDDAEQALHDLLEALEGDLGWRDDHTRLGVRTAEWVKSSRDRSFLLRGSDLRSAEEWLAEAPGKAIEPSADQQAYVLASRKEADRTQRRWRGALVVGLVIAVALATVALIQRNQARDEATTARADELSQEAASVQRAQPSLSLLLGVEAARLERSPQTLSGLLNALWGSPHLARIERGFGQNLRDLEVSPDGDSAAAGYLDGSIRLWDTRSQRPLTRPLHVDRGRVGLSWVNSRVVAVFWADGTIRLFSAPSGKELPVRFSSVPHLEISTSQPAVRFSPNGGLMAVVVHEPKLNTTIRVWSSLGGLPLQEFATGESDGVLKSFQNFSFTPSGTQIVTVVDGGTVHFIDAADGTQVRPPVTVAAGASDGLAFSPDGHTMAVGSLTGVVTRIDVASGAVVGPPLVGNNGNGATTEFAVGGLAYSPDGRYLAASEGNGTVVVWRTSDGAEIGQPFTGHSTYSIYSLRFTGRSDILVTTNANEAITWNLMGRGLRSESSSPLLGAIAVDLRRHLLYNDNVDGVLRVWDTRTMRLLSSHVYPGISFLDLEFYPRTGTISMASASRVLFLRGGPHPKVFDQLSVAGYANAAVLSPAGNQLAVTTLQGALEVIDVTEPGHPAWTARIPQANGSPVLYPVWTADGKYVLVEGSDALIRADTRTHQMTVLAHSTDSSIYDEVIADPTDGRMLTATQDGQISFTAKDGRMMAGPDIVANERVEDMDISPDGRLLVASDDAGQVELWQAHSTRLLVPPLTVSEGVNGVLFIGNERFVVFGNDLAVVDLNQARLAAMACHLVGRNLTHQEFAQYLPYESYHRTCAQYPTGN